MKRYPKDLIQKVRELRATGKTYSEIRNLVGVYIPKSTFSDWCQGVIMPPSYREMVNSFNIKTLGKARATAAASNKLKKMRLLEELDRINRVISKDIERKETAKIALAMLCLGEASKSKSKCNHFFLGNTDPRIIILFMELLKRCFDFEMNKVRCTVQCRADQDTKELELYWQKITKVPKEQFYKTWIDKRTIGKPTLRKGYMGVLRFDYFDTKAQLDLESLADLVYNRVL